MNVIKVRKNFLLDKEIVDNVKTILQSQHKNFTEVISLYFKAIVKDPSILDTIEDSANKRTGSFIGFLDGKIGDETYRNMEKEYFKKSDTF